MKITVTEEWCRQGLKKYMHSKYIGSVHGVGDGEARVRSSLSSAGGDAGFFSGWFHSSWDLLKSSFTNQFILSSAKSCHYTVFLSFHLDSLADLDSVEEDDEDENIAIQTESKSTHTKRFTLDIQAHRWGGWVWQVAHHIQKGLRHWKASAFPSRWSWWSCCMFRIGKSGPKQHGGWEN